MRALVLHGIGDLRYEEVEIPKIEEDEALIKVKVSGICGSDVPRVMEKGTYSFPLIPGHEFSGEVVEVRKGKNFHVGDRVGVYPLLPCLSCSYCKRGMYNLCDSYLYLGSRINGGFAEYVKVPLSNLIHLPPEIGFEEAALTEPASVALHALRRGKIDAGDKVIIFGAGPIGLFCAQWALIMGAFPLVVDIVDEKLEVAKSLGIFSVFNSLKENLLERIMDETEGRGADVAVEAAGVSKTVIQCIELVRKRGKIILLGNIKGSTVLEEKFLSLILRKELNLYGSWNSDFTELPKNEWKITLEQMKKGKLQCKSLISHRFKLSEGVEVFKKLNQDKKKFHKVVFILD